MSLTPVPSNQTQAIGSALLQQLAAGLSTSQSSSGESGLLGDLLTLSPTAQQLTQAPAAVTQARGISPSCKVISSRTPRT